MIQKSQVWRLQMGEDSILHNFLDHDCESLDILPSLYKCYLPCLLTMHRNLPPKKSEKHHSPSCCWGPRAFSLFGIGNVPANNGNQDVDGHENASCNSFDGFWLEQRCDNQRFMPKRTCSSFSSTELLVYAKERILLASWSIRLEALYGW